MIECAHGPIAVGVNGTEASDAAVRYAVAEARRGGVAVKLIHALPDYLPASRPFGTSIMDLAPTGRHLLKGAAEVARAAWADVPLEHTLVAGPWVRAILHACEGTRELVLGCEPRSGVRRLATGTMAVSVAARATLPVIAVAPFMGQEQFGRITVGVKDATESYLLLRSGFAEAVERSSALQVVHAWAMPPGYESLAPGHAARSEVQEAESAPLIETVRALASRFPTVEVSVHVAEGTPARLLQSASQSSDLLVLARRRHAFPVGHIGGTARALLRYSNCPVAIFPSAQQQAHASTDD